jgi:AbrB family looped-hinge helix DNA binding protein
VPPKVLSYDSTARKLVTGEIEKLVRSQLQPALILWRIVDNLVKEKIEIPGYYPLAELILAAVNARKAELRALKCSPNWVVGDADFYLPWPANTNMDWHLPMAYAIAQMAKTSIMAFVDAKVTLDKAGRVVLPKIVRDELRLNPGDTLELTVEGEQMTLRPQRATSPLQKERGVWVFRSGEKLTAAETRQTLRKIREQRSQANARDT